MNRILLCAVVCAALNGCAYMTTTVSETVLDTDGNPMTTRLNARSLAFGKSNIAGAKQQTTFKWNADTSSWEITLNSVSENVSADGSDLLADAIRQILSP